MASPARPRPVADASHRQVWLTVLGALLPGGVLLATALQAGQPITARELGAAALAVLAPLAAAETARQRTVAAAEPQVTPVADPRDDQGATLRPANTQLVELLEQTLAELTPRATRTPATPPPTSSLATSSPAKAPPGRPATTRTFPPIPPSADPAAMAAADGPPDKRQGEDWIDARAQADDERRARERRASTGGPRHGYRGGPTNGGPPR